MTCLGLLISWWVEESANFLERRCDGANPRAHESYSKEIIECSSSWISALISKRFIYRREKVRRVGEKWGGGKIRGMRSLLTVQVVMAHVWNYSLTDLQRTKMLSASTLPSCLVLKILYLAQLSSIDNALLG